MTNHNILDEVFKTEEKDVETFSDIVMMGQTKFAANEVLQLRKTARFQEEVQKCIIVNHGTHENNYVWHIRPAHSRQSWSVSIDRIIFAIGKILNDLVPHDIMIDLFPPKQSYGVEEITVKANNALDHWSISQKDFDKITGQFFEVLTPLVKGPR